MFIDEEQVASLERKMNERGYLEGSEMATTFNMLRANDLIWSFVINNYLLGRDPFPFDLLHWNCDSTRMPAAMHSYYLRNMYMKNLLREPGALTLAGVPIDLSKVDDADLFRVGDRGPHRAVEDDVRRHAAPGRQDALRAVGLRTHRRDGQSARGEQVRLLDEREAARHARRHGSRARSSTKDRGGRTGGSGSTPYLGREVPARVPGKGKLKVHRGRARHVRAHSRRREVGRTRCRAIARKECESRRVIRQDRSSRRPRRSSPPARRAQAACNDCGVVQSMRYVEEKGQGSGLGMVAGGVVGGVLGHQIGSGRGNTVATIAGAGVGAYAGNEVEKNSKKKTYWAVTMRMDNGSTRNFTLHEQAGGPRRRARQARRRRTAARSSRRRTSASTDTARRRVLRASIACRPPSARRLVGAALGCPGIAAPCA